MKEAVFQISSVKTSMFNEACSPNLRFITKVSTRLDRSRVRLSSTHGSITTALHVVVTCDLPLVHEACQCYKPRNWNNPGKSIP